MGDLRYSIRLLAKAPGFTLYSLLVVSLGLAASITVFSLINATLLRSLPYGDAERLVYLWTPHPDIKGLPREMAPPYSDIAEWRKASHSFADITALQQRIVVLGEAGEQRIGCALVADEFFQTMKARLELGRSMNGNDGPHVAVISDSVWRSRFGGDSDVLIKTIVLDSQPYRVIGVAQNDFAYPHGTDFPTSEFARLKRTDVWIPLRVMASEPSAVIGRLRSGVSLAMAQSEISALENRLSIRYPAELRDVQGLVAPFIETAVRPVRPLMRLITGAVVLVLLMVCINFGGLLRSRAAGRMHELGVRRALGADRLRLVRLMLAESLTLSLVAGVVGTLISFLALQVVVKLNPGDIPRFEEATIDVRVLLFALLASIGTGLAAGVFPAISVSTVSISEMLQRGARAISGGTWRGRDALIASEIALAVVLLAGTGLLIRSYLRVQGEEKGFATATLTMSLEVAERMRTPDSVNTVRREAMDRIRLLPGVIAAGGIDDLPLSQSHDAGLIEIEGYPKYPIPLINVRQIAGEYFQAMRIPLIAGRWLDDRDIPVGPQASPKYIVVTASLAKRYFGGRGAALGRRLRFEKLWSTVVGVVGDVRDASLEKPPEPTVYWQCGLADSVVIRPVGSAETIASAVRKAIASLDRWSSITNVRTMNAWVDEATALRRFQTSVLCLFAAMALFLALAGLYGLLSYAVRQRAVEIGIRMAVGATRWEVVLLFLQHGAGLVGSGVASGLLLAFGLARTMTSLLYGVKAFDPVTFAVVPVLIAGVALLACVIPAWRAARTDALAVLRPT